MLSTTALESLAKHLASVAAGFSISSAPLGRPDAVRKAAEESEKLFQDYAKGKPTKQDAYAAALAFMRGQDLDEQHLHLIAGALSEPIREEAGARPVGRSNFSSLLDAYESEAKQGNLWRLTWYGLLSSYLCFDPLRASDAEKAGWGRLRQFLERTWPLIDRQSGNAVVPDWIGVLRSDPLLLAENAAHRYALDYLRGDATAVERLAADLAISESSWFWHALVVSAVRRSADQPDDRFKADIARLLSLIQGRPAFRDEALERILTRYRSSRPLEVHPELRDFVVRKDVWKNPKLRSAGLASSWNRVDEDVWRMVLQWVNWANLRGFFEVLAAMRSSDEGRLAFWSQYLEQISWTRLIFSSQTRWLAHSNPRVRSLIAREEGSYATMSSNADVDAFMMQLGDYVVVEFGKTPNAAYVYKADQLPFDPYSREYAGTSGDLKAGWQGEKAARFTHHHGWEVDAAAELLRLGIRPDKQSGAAAASRAQRAADTPPPAPPPKPPPERPFARVMPPAAQTSAVAPDSRRSAPLPHPPKNARFSMAELSALVASYQGAFIDDRRAGPAGGSGASGRLWVEDPKQNSSLAQKLALKGFRWSDKRSAHYYPGD